ncbi:RIIa domain-containing protein 1-like [Branchiostoma lanceolatum]|uniref:RIIAD1 protein n=1 Tax=Branchiostoma lanceolatum TaxID=7740 RepID=A0A8K0EKU0_BRALA|nr:RIIAD1 [Branchiostoma lanceolatum]
MLLRKTKMAEGVAKPQRDPPQGMEPFDRGALSEEQQAKLNQFKVQTRLGNERYLREHPEVSCMVSGFLGDVLAKKPENIREFAAEYFRNPELPDQVRKEVAAQEEKNRIAAQAKKRL